MSDNKQRSVTDPKGGIFQDLTTRLKLIVRLMGDPRVSPLLKLLPVGSLLYLIVPDIFLGPIDDAAVIWLGTTMFVELCPPDVVQEHMDALKRGATGEWQETVGRKEEEIIDAEYWEEKK